MLTSEQSFFKHISLYIRSNKSMSTKKGISIEDALEILNSRAKAGGEKLEATSPELKKLGQTLDLLNSQTWSRSNQKNDGTSCDCILTQSENKSSDGLVFEPNEDTNVTEKESRVRKELAKQSSSSLFSTLFNLQNERVVAYQKFNAGLNEVLLSGNLTQYPSLCSSITATFAIISSSIRDIQSILEKRNESSEINQACTAIKQLQICEREKLNLTAAWHLEKIREKNESFDGGDEKVQQLLKQGANQLEAKIGVCIERINEVLDDIRCIAVDLND
jgi:hypothetical protein